MKSSVCCINLARLAIGTNAHSKSASDLLKEPPHSELVVRLKPKGSLQKSGRIRATFDVLYQMIRGSKVKDSWEKCYGQETSQSYCSRRPGSYIYRTQIGDILEAQLANSSSTTLKEDNKTSDPSIMGLTSEMTSTK